MNTGGWWITRVQRGELRPKTGQRQEAAAGAATPSLRLNTRGCEGIWGGSGPSVPTERLFLGERCEENPLCYELS